MASILNSLGLTFRNTGFVKFNLFFPVLVAAAHFTLKASIDAGFSQVVMSKCGVVGKKFPFFVLTMLPVIAIVCAIVAIMGLTIYSKTGYESQNSRAQKDPSALKRAGLPKCTSDFVLTFPIYKLDTQTHNRDRENAGCSVQYLGDSHHVRVYSVCCSKYGCQS